ncbi:MAG: hypothetical protein GWP05_06955 [Anaerolineaceae bacterium]|nr:hypothetical protein [Anaerolineaceae bacterium]
MNTAICTAISKREVISFDYDGGNRTVEPHCHGVSTADNEVLRGYQIAGSSASGNPMAWKLFKVSQMGTIKNTGQIFQHNRPGYNPNDEGMSKVCCHV